MEMNHNWLSDPRVFKVNRLKAKASLNYYRNEDEMYHKHSGFIHSLNGMWKFHYSNSVNDLLQDFYKEDFDCSAWDEIKVPAHIQLEGYGTPMYVNQIYPWSGSEQLIPGELPKHNPIGSYVTFFDSSILEKDTDTHLVFEGAESGIALWVNGHFIGYSEDSFTPGAFDITPFIKEGKNKIACNVYRFTSGSWLEDQDFWRFSGIFRDVHLDSIPHIHVEDLKIETKLNASCTQADILIDTVLKANEDYHLHYTLKDDYNYVIKEIETTDTSVSFHLSHPELWSAEDPYLYQLVIRVSDANDETIEYIHQNIGVREFRMINNIMCINGKRIVFNGVDRHEFSCETGRVVSYEMTEQDILTMKRNNINALRTSHYPNQTFLYDLCDRYGIYVIDEVNMETHGTWSEGFDPEHIIPHDKEEWLDIILDRAENMVQRDKNHPSILIWSCGNESYGGKDIYEMSRHIKEMDPTRLVHYEGVVHDERYPDTTDMRSEMYTPAKDIEEYLQKHTDKPFILCEYAHAMGNSNGGLYKYTDLAKKYPHYQGGFIWDFVDQAIMHEGKLYYGGDFRERPSDYDFCGNGILFADRKETPKMQEVKYCYQPVDITFFDQYVTIKNNFLFRDLGDYVLQMDYYADGKLLYTFRDVVDCAPSETVEEDYDIDSFIDHYGSEHEYSVILSVFDEDNHEIAHEQYILPYQKKEQPCTLPVSINEDYLNIGVVGEHFNAIFSKQKGLVSYKSSNKEFIREPIRPQFFRPSTNNDVENKYGYRYGEWLLASQYAKCRYVSCEKEETKCTIHYAYDLPNGNTTEMIYEVDGEGKIRIDMTMDRPNGIEPPAFGIQLVTYPELDHVDYYGFGPAENYIDRNKGALLGNYHYEVKENMTPYLYPQECGNRTNVRSFTVSSKKHALSVSGEPFEFSARPYKPMIIENTSHQWEFPDPYETVLCIYKKQMGVAGDNTWGAQTHEEFLLKDEDYHFTITLKAQ